MSLIRSFKAVSVVAMITCAPLTVADVYVGGGYSYMALSDTFFDEDYNFSSLTGRVGYEFNEYYSLEARFSLGLTDDEADGVSYDLDYVAGVYGRLSLPFGSGFYPYLALGYSDFKLSGELSGSSASNSDSDLSYGLGLDYKLTEELTVNAEYRSL